MNYGTIYKNVFSRILRLLASFHEDSVNIHFEITSKQELVFLDKKYFLLLWHGYETFLVSINYVPGML